MNTVRVALKGNLKFILGLGATIVLAILSSFVGIPLMLFFLVVGFLAMFAKLLKVIFVWRNWLNKESRVVNFGALLVILLAILLIGMAFKGVHSFHNMIAREKGDYVVEQVKAYYQAHGKYPDKMADLNIVNSPSDIQYINTRRDKPIVLYPDPVSRIDRWYYDFEKGSWRFEGEN